MCSYHRDFPTITGQNYFANPVSVSTREGHQRADGDGGLPGGGIDHTCVVGLLGTTNAASSWLCGEEREVYHFL